MLGETWSSAPPAPRPSRAMTTSAKYPKARHAPSAAAQPDKTRPHRTVRLTPGMRCAIPGHHHPQYRQEHHPEDHLLDGPPPLMSDQPPDSSNCRDQEQGNDHALIVVVVTGPCKPASTLDAPRGTCIRPARLAFLLRADPGSATAHDNGGKPGRHAPSATAPPDLTRTHHEHMTTRPTRRDRRRSEGAAPRLAQQSGRTPAAADPRNLPEARPRLLQGTYGDDPPSPTSPSAAGAGRSSRRRRRLRRLGTGTASRAPGRWLPRSRVPRRRRRG
jgi:hypothetical protein